MLKYGFSSKRGELLNKVRLKVSFIQKETNCFETKFDQNSCFFI